MLIQHSMEQRKKDFTFSFHYNDTKMQKKLIMCSYLKILISLLRVLKYDTYKCFRIPLTCCKMHDI